MLHFGTSPRSLTKGGLPNIDLLLNTDYVYIVHKNLHVDVRVFVAIISSTSTSIISILSLYTNYNLSSFYLTE